MKKKYEFKIKLIDSRIMPILNIQSLRKTYPINFTEINVPIDAKKVEGENIYSLNFLRSYDGKEKEYKEDYLRRRKQKLILDILEEKIAEDVVEAMNGRGNLIKNGKTIRFNLDDGFTPRKDYGPAQNRTSFRSGGKSADVLRTN